jgi:hypothetical protein
VQGCAALALTCPAIKQARPTRFALPSGLGTQPCVTTTTTTAAKQHEYAFYHSSSRLDVLTRTQTTAATKPRIPRTVPAAALAGEASFRAMAASRALVAGATIRRTRYVLSLSNSCWMHSSSLATKTSRLTVHQYPRYYRQPCSLPVTSTDRANSSPSSAKYATSRRRRPTRRTDSTTVLEA